MPYTILPIEVTEFSQNCRVIYDDTREALVIDPGGESDRILQELSSHKLRCTQIWLTHSHLDHCGGVRPLKDKTGATLFAHPIEAAMRAHVVDIAKMYGIASGMTNCPEPETPITGGETLRFAGADFKVLFTPGHAPGHVCFYDAGNGILIAGDTLFQGSIGRTDIPGGNPDLLLESIRREILTLPGETRVLPGHGPDTTVEKERRSNPFLTGGFR